MPTRFAIEFGSKIKSDYIIQCKHFRCRIPLRLLIDCASERNGKSFIKTEKFQWNTERQPLKSEKNGLLLVTMLRSIVISKTLGSRHNTCSSHWINSVFMTWWKKNTVSSNQFKTFAEICVFVISVLVACLSIGGGNKAASYFHHKITANVIFVSTIRFKRYKMLWF